MDGERSHGEEEARAQGGSEHWTLVSPAQIPSEGEASVTSQEMPCINSTSLHTKLSAHELLRVSQTIVDKSLRRSGNLGAKI